MKLKDDIENTICNSGTYAYESAEELSLKTKYRILSYCYKKLKTIYGNNTTNELLNIISVDLCEIRDNKLCSNIKDFNLYENFNPNINTKEDCIYVKFGNTVNKIIHTLNYENNIVNNTLSTSVINKDYTEYKYIFDYLEEIITPEILKLEYSEYVYSNISSKCYSEDEINILMNIFYSMCNDYISTNYVFNSDPNAAFYNLIFSHELYDLDDLFNNMKYNKSKYRYAVALILLKFCKGNRDLDLKSIVDKCYPSIKNLTWLD